MEEFQRDNGIDLSSDKMAMQRLKDAAEKAKKDLSGVSQTQISLPFISAGAAGPLHLEVTLTRAKFDQLTQDLVERTKRTSSSCFYLTRFISFRYRPSIISWWINSLFQQLFGSGTVKKLVKNLTNQ